MRLSHQVRLQFRVLTDMESEGVEIGRKCHVSCQCTTIGSVTSYFGWIFYFVMERCLCSSGGGANKYHCYIRVVEYFRT